MSQRGEQRTKRDAGHGRERWSSWQRKRRRELGQNFLKDKRVARRIVAESGVEKGDLVVVPSWTACQIQAETGFDLFRFGDQPIVEKLAFARTYVEDET